MPGVPGHREGFAGTPVAPSLQPCRLRATALGLRHWASNWRLSLERSQSARTPLPASDSVWQAAVSLNLQTKNPRTCSPSSSLSPGLACLSGPGHSSWRALGLSG